MPLHAHRQPNESAQGWRPSGLAPAHLVATMGAVAVAGLLVPVPVYAAAAGAEDHAIRDVIARLFNFAILAGVLVYFLRAPIGRYLDTRGVQIREDLVTAARTREEAAAQLAGIDRQLQSLPAELEALKAQGAADVQAERARIAKAAELERGRLLDQTRREIGMRLRIARRDLVDLGAHLAVQVARERISRTITPDDQLRLIDRYTRQLGEAR